MRIVNCVPIVRNGSVTVMARDIGQAFRDHGLDVMDIDYQPGQKVPRNLPRLLDWLSTSKDGGLLVDINGVVANSSLVARAMQERPGTFNCFTFLTDTPFNFNDRLRKWPENALVGFVDRSFDKLVTFMEYDRPDFIFHPHGGPPIAGDHLANAMREIDILFIGNITAVNPPPDHARSLYGENTELVELFTESFENVDPAKTPFESTRETGLNAGHEFTRDDIALVSKHLEIYLSNASRLRVLSSLDGLGVTIVGKIEDDALGSDTDVRVLGFQPFDACVDLMGRAKILLNIVPSFPNGGHERIFYAQSQGAGVLTTRSTFLEEDRRAHGCVEFFDIARDEVRDKLTRFHQSLNTGDADKDTIPAFTRPITCGNTGQSRYWSVRGNSSPDETRACEPARRSSCVSGQILHRRLDPAL
jgi:hypothetical protein